MNNEPFKLAEEKLLNNISEILEFSIDKIEFKSMAGSNISDIVQSKIDCIYKWKFFSDDILICSMLTKQNQVEILSYYEFFNEETKENARNMLKIINRNSYIFRNIFEADNNKKVEAVYDSIIYTGHVITPCVIPFEEQIKRKGNSLEDIKMMKTNSFI